MVGCSHDTLARRFKDELADGRLQGKASLRRKQYEIAMSGNTTMLIWLGKQALGQSDKQEILQTGPIVLDLSSRPNGNDSNSQG